MGRSSGFKYTKKGKQMLNDPKRFFESFMHKRDSCRGKFIFNGSTIVCNMCGKETVLDK